jgi:hypothetical protein
MTLVFGDKDSAAFPFGGILENLFHVVAPFFSIKPLLLFPYDALPASFNSGFPYQWNI